MWQKYYPHFENPSSYCFFVCLKCDWNDRTCGRADSYTLHKCFLSKALMYGVIECFKYKEILSLLLDTHFDAQSAVSFPIGSAKGGLVLLRNNFGHTRSCFICSYIYLDWLVFYAPMNTGHYPIPNNDLLSFNSCNITRRTRSIFQYTSRAAIEADQEEGSTRLRILPGEYTDPYTP